MLLKKSEYAALIGVDAAHVTREVQRRHIFTDKDGNINPDGLNYGYTLSHIGKVRGNFLSYRKLAKRWELWSVTTDMGREWLLLMPPFDYPNAYFFFPASERFTIKRNHTATETATGKVYEVDVTTGAEM